MLSREEDEMCVDGAMLSGLLREQVGSQAHCAFVGLVVLPFAYLGLVSREEYVGHVP